MNNQRKNFYNKKGMNEFKKLILAVTNEGGNKLLRKTLDALEIEHIYIHGLRHTHASVLIYKGANIYSVSKRIEQSDIQTTLDHYSHVLKEMEERDKEIAINVYSS
ncbi:integrase [Lysinibacillus sp. KCTC 33748]|uniref:tyrosine-type recombinase/integrase n=1 Tax=unclassified Lysinibacillus TaxID=2636778 RepID=UPI0009A8065A|nr:MULTISPECIES: tyrosine-type recombinase/integrase [unclassified Lysinibacillus]OXS68673.1 integrase [Lysinibacillus sp. KCTC 33748]